MDKPKLTIREIIFEGIKKFAGEIIGVVLLASFLWFFPSLKSLFTEHTFPEKNESQSEIQRELEAHRKEEERLKEELKRHEEALKAEEAKKAEEARQKTEAPKAKAENTESESSTQTVKADTGGVVKAQQNENAREVTTQAKQKSGAELLRDVLEKYKPEDFFSAKLNPKIFYDEKTHKPYIQVTEVFNQSAFWDKFLPELRNALDGVAVKKSKQFYTDKVRNANQMLNKQGYFDGWSDYPYEFNVAEVYSVVIPNDVASCTVYKMPFGGFGGQTELSYMERILAADDAFFMGTQLGEIPTELRGIGLSLLHFVQKMCKPFAYSITYLDNSGNVISVQVIRKKLGAFTVYPSLPSNSYSRRILSHRKLLFAPGYILDAGRNFAALSTENYNTAHSEEGYKVELDSQELQRLDSMKFEVIFE